MIATAEKRAATATRGDTLTRPEQRAVIAALARRLDAAASAVGVDVLALLDDARWLDNLLDYYVTAGVEAAADRGRLRMD